MFDIEDLQETKAQEAIDLAAACFGEEWRMVATEDFMATFEKGTYVPRTFIAQTKQRIVGLIQSNASPLHPRIQCFSWVCVAPDFRGQGIGRHLIAHAERDAIERRFKDRPGTFLLVSAINPAYYRKIGYEGQLTTYDHHPFVTKHYYP